ncbi:hypothetical protein Slin_3698 [Spirosoma linguale DSM 74]|uniref:HEPN domain-containing protein n=2 Tax=Spirosoma TaxID=107 RepID=D2QBW5_SPILD|nr:hypothetical protein Slin_3698 [Spirosoma linguale DSM 74]
MFESVTLDPTIWVDQARRLLISAQLPLDELNKAKLLTPSNPNERSQKILCFMPTYMMLAGFALENVIKGLIVCRLPEPRQVKDLKKFFKHDLVSIIPNDIPVSQEENDLLKRLAAFTIWNGRYPMPTEAKHYNNAVLNELLCYKSGDENRVKDLFHRFERLITNEYEG